MSKTPPQFRQLYDDAVRAYGDGLKPLALECIAKAYELDLTKPKDAAEARAHLALAVGEDQPKDEPRFSGTRAWESGTAAQALPIIAEAYNLNLSTPEGHQKAADIFVNLDNHALDLAPNPLRQQIRADNIRKDFLRQADELIQKEEAAEAARIAAAQQELREKAEHAGAAWDSMRNERMRAAGFSPLGPNDFDEKKLQAFRRIIDEQFRSISTEDSK